MTTWTNVTLTAIHLSLVLWYQLGGELQDFVLGHLRPLRGPLRGDQQWPQVHREHRLRALRGLQRHHGGGPPEHAHRHDQQLLPGD